MHATAAFISGENGGRQVENDSKKFLERIMNPRRRWEGVDRSFIRIPTALYGNSVGNISILAGIAEMALLRPVSRTLSYRSCGDSVTFAAQ